MHELSPGLMERHPGITMLAGVVLLILIGLLAGKGIGELGVRLVDAVLTQASPTR